MEKVFQAFLTHLKDERGRSENTLLAYKSDFSHFQRYLSERHSGQLDISQLTDEILDDYLVWLEARGYRTATIARKWAALRSFLGFLKREGLIGNHELGQNLQIDPIVREPPLALSREQTQELLDAPSRLNSPLGLRDAALLAMMYETGLRVKDILQVRVADIDIESGVLSFPRKETLGKAAGKVADYLRDGRPHLARVVEEQALFLNQRGSGLTRQGLWLIVKRWSMEIGIKHRISPHSLRYSLAQHLSDQGKDRRELQMRLGLKSPNSVRFFRAALEKKGDK